MNKDNRPIGMEDIARLAGVSRPTVSRALNDSPLVSDKTKERIREIARRHGFVINRSAQNLRLQRSNTIAVVIDFPALPEHRISDPFHFELLGSITNALAALGKDVLLCSLQENSAAGMEAQLLNRGVDGVIFVGQSDHHDQLQLLQGSGIHFVVWGAHLPDAKYCIVGSDNHLGGRLVGERFWEMGRNRALIISTRDDPEMNLRRAGFEAGWQGAVETLFVPDLSFETSRTQLAAHLFDKKQAPDAIFATSDTMALGALAALGDAGVSVPGACAVCGYDDSPLAAQNALPLTTVRQETRSGGQQLVDQLMIAIGGDVPTPVKLQTELIVRGS